MAVVAYGAINAAFPEPDAKQVSLTLNYSGGWGTRYYVKNPASLNDTCTPYDGPKLEWLVAACKAWDGTYWALQSWQRPLPNHGLAPRPENAVWELRLSHWKGPLPAVAVKADWAYGGRWEHLYGSFTYLGKPMHGFRTTTYGAPLDSWGVLVYLDTLNSRYGKGEGRRREPAARVLGQGLPAELGKGETMQDARRTLTDEEIVTGPSPFGTVRNDDDDDGGDIGDPDAPTAPPAAPDIGDV